MELDPKHTRIAVLGLGYVGLPLAVAFSKKFDTIGFDINAEKVALMSNGVDPTDELEEGALSEALQGQLSITHDPSTLAHANIYIITVPTDINPDKSPNLEPLIKASELVGQYL